MYRVFRLEVTRQDEDISGHDIWYQLVIFHLSRFVTEAL